MTDEARKILDALRFCSKQTDGSKCSECPANRNSDCHNLLFEKAADLIESLAKTAEQASAKAAMYDTAMEAAANAQRERDDCTMRMQAAENDLHMRRCCFTCKHYYEQREECESCFDDKASRADGTWMANWVWRGPCSENESRGDLDG